jgi:acetolactate synthase-1/2/3 large subunit
MMMNGSESLVRTLLANRVDVCFANPGTSEMHFVAALDRVEGIRSVLCLFEGVASGAADGFYRMRNSPAATLLHLGPGLGNALSNLHNAKKARSGIVNIVGEHATYHLAYDAPLTSDIETLARPMSHWVRTSRGSEQVAADGASAVAAAGKGQGQIATLILPADVSWGPAYDIVAPLPPAPADAVDADMVATCARTLREQPRSAILLGGPALRGRALDAAGRIAAASGCALFAEANNARHERGSGRVPVQRLPMIVTAARKMLEGIDRLILVGAKQPVAFFAYPDQPSVLTSDACEITTLSDTDGDAEQALVALCAELGANSARPVVYSGTRPRPPASTGRLSPSDIELALAATLPDDAVIVDESISTGRAFSAVIQDGVPHDWMHSMGASLGYALPVSVGAAIAAPDRKIVALVGDGSALYTPQALWTMVRENLDVTVLIFANRSYEVLRGELARVGAGNPGRRALDMLSLDRPAIDWCGLAKALGVEVGRADSGETLSAELKRGFASQGPYLIEVII